MNFFPVLLIIIIMLIIKVQGEKLARAKHNEGN